MNFGTVRSFAEQVIENNRHYSKNHLKLIPKELLDTEVTDKNYEEVARKLDEIRSTKTKKIEISFLFNVAALTIHQ